MFGINTLEIIMKSAFVAVKRISAFLTRESFSVQFYSLYLLILVWYRCNLHCNTLYRLLW